MIIFFLFSVSFDWDDYFLIPRKEVKETLVKLFQIKVPLIRNINFFRIPVSLIEKKQCFFVKYILLEEEYQSKTQEFIETYKEKLSGQSLLNFSIEDTVDELLVFFEKIYSTICE